MMIVKGSDAEGAVSFFHTINSRTNSMTYKGPVASRGVMKRGSHKL